MDSLGRRNIAIIIMLAWLILSPYALTTSTPEQSYSPINTMVLAAPTLSGPSYLEFENGSMGETLVYQASDPNPKNYSVTVDGTVFSTATWIGGDITVSLDPLYDGDWIDTLPKDLNFVIRIFNDQGEGASASTLVRVVPDTTAPVIDPHDNITYEEGSFGHFIRWNVSEANPEFYNITRQSNEPINNFTIVESGTWTGENFSISIDGLSAPYWHIYTLFVRDIFGRNTTGVVNVTVTLDLTNPTITSPDDIEYEFGDEGYEILWHAYDSNPENYTITAVIHYNDTTYGNYAEYHTFIDVIESNWVFIDPLGDDIVVVVDGLFLGNYTITLTLYDIFGRMTNDSVNVTVYEDIRAPIITSSGDLTYEEGYTGYSINWTVEENNPLLFNLTLDGVDVVNGVWDGEGYELNVDDLEVGVHEYNMTYTDFFNQSAYSIIEVEVSPDAHIPTVSGITAIQVFSTPTSNNLTIQAYVWDLNKISSLEIQWGVGDPESLDFTFETKDMEQTEIENIFVTHLGNYQYGVRVWYKILAQDNSSVQLLFDSGWLYVDITSQSFEGAPAPLYAVIVILGSLSLLVILVLYFRTKTR